ncbi:MAG: hypothetical protein AAGG68_29285 [Bacteroidota bacterium]
MLEILSKQEIDKIKKIGKIPTEIISSDQVKIDDERSILEIRLSSLDKNAVEYVGFQDLIINLRQLQKDTYGIRQMMKSETMILVLYSNVDKSQIYGWYYIPM